MFHRETDDQALHTVFDSWTWSLIRTTARQRIGRWKEEDHSPPLPGGHSWGAFLSAAEGYRLGSLQELEEDACRDCEIFKGRSLTITATCFRRL